MAMSTPSNLATMAGGRKRWIKMLPFFVAIIVVGQIWFLGRLEFVKNVSLIEGWSGSNSIFSPITSSLWSMFIMDKRSCKDWLEKEDAVVYKRDFRTDPVLVSGSNKDWSSCAVGCKFGSIPGRTPDAAFGLSGEPSTVSVHRSMESSHYYADNNIDNARRRGFQIIMTTSLRSDVPVGYFSWAEYDIMAPVQQKTEDAAAFISNCGARNFRLQALDLLIKLNIKLDSYGACHRNRDGNVNKVQTLKRYKFSLAFENSNEEDYVTEKFFQSLVAGAIPVVIGAPNILDFAPSPGSVLHIRELKDVSRIADKIKFLSANPEAFNQSIRWKFEGPSDSFKALVDMAAVHSSCRLCIHIATKIREKEESSSSFKNRPCKCTRSGSTLHHLYVRERGTFDFSSIFLRSDNLTRGALEWAVLDRFGSMKHKPIWKSERPEMLRGGNRLVVYRIYPADITQREALYSFQFGTDAELRRYVETHPCAKFEVIFV